MKTFPWFKMWPADLMERPEWRRLSPEARSLISLAFCVLGRARHIGREATLEDLADYSGYQPRKVDRILSEPGVNAFITIVERTFHSRLFDVMQESNDRSGAERARKYRDSHRYVTRDVTAKVTDRGQRTESEEIINIISPAKPEKKQKAKSEKLAQPTPIAEVVFTAEDENRVARLLLRRNASGRMTDSVRLQLRSDLDALLREAGQHAWRYGLDKVLTSEKKYRDPVAYASSIIKSHANETRASAAVRSDNVIPLFTGSSSPAAEIQNPPWSKAPPGKQEGIDGDTLGNGTWSRLNPDGTRWDRTDGYIIRDFGFMRDKIAQNVAINGPGEVRHG